MADLLQHVRESGFPFADRLIHLFVGGSELHGAKVHSKVVAMAQKFFVECEEAAKSSSLPERVDRPAVSRLLADSYRLAWSAG